jgi:hypothetical protein
VLVNSAPVTLVRDHGHPPNLGVLMGPSSVYRDAHKRGYRWAADNDAFTNWNESAYLRMLDTIRDMPGCLFVTAPDVVANAAATLRLFEQWLPQLARYPVALVAQDGLTVTDTPWDEIAALFIGGSSEWKMGDEAHTLALEAKRRGLWLHMGRVNTRQRFRWAKSIGCDSVDGSSFSKFRRTHLPWALQWAAAPVQLNTRCAQ